MRRSLRFQILAPTLGVMLIVVLCVSIVNAWVAARRTRLQLESQLRDVARTLVEANFPLTDSVLRQASALSGAELAVADSQGEIIASSRSGLQTAPSTKHVQQPGALRLDETTSFAGESYFHAVVRRGPNLAWRGNQWIHLFYSERQWRQAWREAVAPPLLAGGVALAALAAIMTWVAARWTRPIADLRIQVERIAQGDYRALPLPPRDDEIRDLALSVNRLAEMLTRYEDEVRRRERLRTLGQLGGGIAHQMRNAATGCRMALDFHRRQKPESADDESLSVAVRQLELMETYLRRFLTLGAEHAAPQAMVDLREVIDDVLPLLRPTASHLGADLRWTSPRTPFPVRGDETGLAQLVVNLALNAIEAATQTAIPASTATETALRPAGAESNALAPRGPGIESVPRVEIRLLREGDRGDMARLEVIDNGAGPAPHVRDQLFEPLVTDKPDGAGLGLPVAREIAQLHQGDLRWERREDRTWFIVEFPLLLEE